jgi:proteasome lid subunit RPN8/RPN11
MLHLAEQEIALISEHAERDYPFECCGLLVGSFTEDGIKKVAETYPISNAREESAKRNRFLITPEELIRGERYATTKQLEVVGFYHSHPDHPAIPSEYDREHAWPTYSYLVVSVDAGRVGDLRSWELQFDRSRFLEEEITKGRQSCLSR